MSDAPPATGPDASERPRPPGSLWSAVRARVAAWQVRSGPAREVQGRERWVLVDVETSGLDVRQDALLAIAAVGLEVDWATRQLVMRPGDSLALDLRPARVSDKDNILLHGIGAGRQQRAPPPQQALACFLQWVADARLLAFHAAFDQALLTRDCHRHLGQSLSAEWLDIAPLCAVAYPRVRARSLDEWMAHFRIPCAARHEAAADVLAEAELLQRIWPQVALECGSWIALRRYASRQAWIAGR